MDIVCRHRGQPEPPILSLKLWFVTHHWCHCPELCLLSGPRPVGYLCTVNSLEAVCVSHLSVEGKWDGCVFKVPTFPLLKDISELTGALLPSPIILWSEVCISLAQGWGLTFMPNLCATVLGPQCHWSLSGMWEPSQQIHSEDESSKPWKVLTRVWIPTFKFLPHYLVVLQRWVLISSFFLLPH